MTMQNDLMGCLIRSMAMSCLLWLKKKHADKYHDPPPQNRDIVRPGSCQLGGLNVVGAFYKNIFSNWLNQEHSRDFPYLRCLN